MFLQFNLKLVEERLDTQQRKSILLQLIVDSLSKLEVRFKTITKLFVQ